MPRLGGAGAFLYAHKETDKGAIPEAANSGMLNPARSSVATHQNHWCHPITPHRSAPVLACQPCQV